MKIVLGIILLIVYIYCLSNNPGKKFDSFVSNHYEKSIKSGNLSIFLISVAMGAVVTLAFYLLCT